MALLEKVVNGAVYERTRQLEIKRESENALINYVLFVIASFVMCIGYAVLVAKAVDIFY